MPIQKLHFFAPVANADSSILQIRLNSGFNFDSMTKNEGISFIIQLEKVPSENFYNYWHHGHTVLNSDQLIFIKNSFEFDLPINEKGKPDTDYRFYKFIYEFVEKNVEKPIQLLRLFSEGNLHIPYWIVYYFDHEEMVVLFALGLKSSYTQNVYHLKDNEIREAQTFIDTIKIPSPLNFISIAHENYEISYFINSDSQAFLSLMISLEILFKQKQDNSKIIASKIGTLLGNSDTEKNIIQCEISRLYKMRNELVHEGKPVFHYVGEQDDVKVLRQQVRGCLKKIIPLNLSKADLLEYLRSLQHENLHETKN